jgi:hypothetical protein
LFIEMKISYLAHTFTLLIDGETNMKVINKLVASSVVTGAVLAGGLMAPATATAEISASAAVANMYLWRGIDLGDGSPAVSGDLTYSVGDTGAYAGIWMSSGDSSLGSEYDYYAGYATEFGGLGVDLSVWNYNYSDLNGINHDTTAELSEVILGLSLGGFSLNYLDNIAGASGYEYWTLGYGVDKYSVTVGFHDTTTDADMTHVDIGYAFNDNLSFTVSKVVDQDFSKSDPGAYDEDVLYVLVYSLPIL